MASGSKKKTVFVCQNCGYESAKWVGNCPVCREWNTFTEETVKSGIRSDAPSAVLAKKLKKDDGSRPVPLNRIENSEENRTSSGMEELDRVFGGGIVKGSMILIGGDPGIGKSTLLLQVCRNISSSGHDVLYVSGEESLRQIKMRSDRLGSFSDSLKILSETDLDDIADIVSREKPEFVVIDSIQTMFNESVGAAPGSVSQIRETTAVLLRIAKDLNITIFVIGHVTKEGAVAGPRVLEHMVDTVLYFEGDSRASYRVLRAVKNRFGSTNEIGVFEMNSEGLREVLNPSEYMLSGKPEDATGAVVTCTMEGTRPLLLEIQALVAKTAFGFPRRTAAGIDFNRINLLIAVIEKRIGINLSEYDAYVNIAGGIRINEPSADLAIVLALISSYKDIVLGDDIAVFGEVGLAGEVRGVTRAEARVREAKKLGYTKIIMPKSNVSSVKGIEGVEILGVENLKAAYALIK